MAEASPFRYKRSKDSPGFLLFKLHAAWQERLRVVLESFGITQTQYAILASLRWFEERHEPPTQTHLVEHARIEKMTLSKAIRQLERDRLLAREPSADDSRAVRVRLTAKGRRLTERAVVAIESADEEFFRRLSSRDLGAFRRLMSQLTG